MRVWKLSFAACGKLNRCLTNPGVDMTALVDLAIAILVATGFVTLLVKLPMAIQSWFLSTFDNSQVCSSLQS